MTDNYQYFIDKIEERARAINESDPILADIRKSALARFEKSGLPTRKHEDWKYTSVAFLNDSEFSIVERQPDKLPSPEEIKFAELPGAQANILVFVNGYYAPSLSKITSKHKGLVVAGLAESKKKYAETINSHFDKYSDKNNPFTSANTALAEDGAFVYVPEGKKIEEPFHFVFLTFPGESSPAIFARNLIVCDPCSSIKIIESCYSIGEKPSFASVVTEVKVGAFAEVDFCKLQNCAGNMRYIGETRFSQDHASVVHDAQITLKGKFVRNDLAAVHNGELCDTQFYGLYFLDGKTFADNHTFVDHAKPRCTSKEIYKGILADDSVAVFNGKVIVRPDSQKTDAYQSNKNILLSNNAQVNTKPQLEIYADDVKCSHGATTGYLDKDSLFYLRARGISEEKAKALLLNAFASDAVDKVRVAELRDAIKQSVAGRLGVGDIYFCDVLDEVGKE